MKKLISAASAMAMAASMVGAAVPFTTGAAEASKTIELRAYLNKDGSAASTTIDTTNGAVTVPIGVYYVENTADSRSVLASFCVTSKDGDASNTYVKFDGIYKPNEAYFNADQTVTVADGSTAEMKSIVAFAGTVKANRTGARFDSLGTYTCNVDDKQASQNVTTAWGSVVWTQPVDGSYAWTGAKSDDFPFFVFDATFAKGTPAGTYTIDFIDMSTDPEHPEIKSTMVEGEGGAVYTPGAGNLTTKGITITVGGEPVQQPTTEPATKPATEPATKPATEPATKPPTSQGNQGNVQEDFIIEGGKYTAEPGDVVMVDFIAHANGHKSATMRAELDTLPAGITAEMTDNTNYCFDSQPGWSLQGSTYGCETRNAAEDPLDVAEDVVITFDVTLPADIKPGEYEINLSRFHVVEQAQVPVNEYDCLVIPAVIKVEGEIDDQPTEPVTTPSTTQAPTKPTTTGGDTGTVLYGDANCNGKVDIADVVVLNKWLNDNSAYDLTAQGKINADCCDPKAGTPDENDSKAIIRSIVHLNELPCTAADLK